MKLAGYQVLQVESVPRLRLVVTDGSIPSISRGPQRWNGWWVDDVSMAFSVWPVPQGLGCEVVETCGDKLTCRFLQKVSHHVLTVQNSNITRYCRPHPENLHELPWKKALRNYKSITIHSHWQSIRTVSPCFTHQQLTKASTRCAQQPWLGDGLWHWVYHMN